MTKTSMRAILLCGTAFAGANLSAGLACAQDSGGGQTTLQEIIVTAQKRQENIQNVPVAVTAVNQATLEANRVVNVMDLSGLAPGFVARTNPGSLGSASYSIRGIFASASVPGQDREVSTYLDGVYLGSIRGGVFDLPDIQQVELLRGPQGTLFGRNATAGAVNVTTRDPTGNFKVRQEFTGGNYDEFRTRTSIDTPQWGPFSAYFTYVHDERRGDVRNLGAGTCFNRTSPFNNIGVTCSPKWLGSHNTNDYFAAIKFAPVDNFSIVYKFDQSNQHNTPEGRAAVLNPNDPTGIGGMLTQILAAQPAGGGAFGPVVLDPSAKRLNAVNNAWSQPGYIKAMGHNITMTWRPTDNLTVKNITAYRFSSAYGPSTILGLSGLQFTQGAVTPYATFAAFASVPGFASFPAGTQAAIIGGIANALSPAVGSYFAGYEGASWSSAWQASNETEVNYQSKFLTLTAGALYYYGEETDSGLPGFAPNPAFAIVPFQITPGNIQVGIAKTTSIAAYAQAEFHVTDQLDVVVGGRVTRDKKVGDFTTGGTFNGTAITGATSFPWTFEKTKPTFSVGVNYKPDNSLLLYAKYSTAFLSGGAVGPLSFRPETVSSVEGGVKSEWFDRRLRANLAVWYADYKDLQSAQSGQNVGEPQIAVVVVDNGQMKAEGFEFELAAKPIEGLTLNGSVSYTHAKLLDPNPAVAQGEPYLWAADPPWSSDMSAEYVTRPVYKEAYLSLRMDANYTGKYRSIATPVLVAQVPQLEPYAFIPDTWLVNGRLALRNIKTHDVTTEIALWVRNLLDTRNPAYTFAFGTFGGTVNWQPARTFGLDVKLEF